MKIIITGASGFVGKNLSSYLLSKGHVVSHLSLRDPQWRVIIPSEGEALVHLAGKAHDTSNTSKEEEYYQVNRDLTIDLFHRFLQSDIRDFYYFSSVKAVADSVNGPLGEEINGDPRTAYGKSKFEAEQYLLTQDLPLAKRLFIIRPCMIHGPGNKGNLNLLYNVVKKGLPWPLASFENERSFLSIDNLNYLIEKMILASDLQSGIYNFADDATLSTNELIKVIAAVVETKDRLWHIPVAIIQAGVKLGDIFPLPLNSERLKKLTESYVVSNAKIKKSLQIANLPVSIKAGLTKTIASFEQK